MYHMISHVTVGGSPGNSGYGPEELGHLVIELVLVFEGGKDDSVLGVSGDQHGGGEGGRLVDLLYTHHVSQW